MLEWVEEDGKKKTVTVDFSISLPVPKSQSSIGILTLIVSMTVSCTVLDFFF